jgi:hypothetical protein
LINAQIRRSVLATFPAGTPCLVLAPARAGFGPLLAERNDPAIELRVLGGELPPSAIPHVVLEGIDDLADPIGFLTGMRAAMPAARLFALVANASHLVALGAFFSEHALAAQHPLTAAEIEPLFNAAGWKPLAVKPLIDAALPAPGAAPCTVTVGAIGFQCYSAAVLERGGTAAFLVIADGA